MIKVLVSGAAGRMGQEVVKAVGAEPDMTVVAVVDPAHAGRVLPDECECSITVTGDLAATIEAEKPDVMVDFTSPDAVEANIRTALEAGVDCVVGTTGTPLEVLERLEAGAPEGTALFVAPNFAVGAVLMMRFAAQAARYMPHVEIVELHHDRKADAPSGTAMRTAYMIGAARDEVPDAPGRETEVADGARGALVDGVRVHSVRLPGLVAHQEVLFGGHGQMLSLRHDTIDRSCFMPGVLMAVRRVGGLEGLVVGLDALMED